MLDVPTELVAFLADLLAERISRGNRTDGRALTCIDRALFALVWFWESRDIPLIGKGLWIYQATAYRYLDEAVGVLAARPPTCTMRCNGRGPRPRGPDEGWSNGVLDGKVVDTDRLKVKKVSKKGKTLDGWYSGKTHDFGSNVQALFRPDGLPISVSSVESGWSNDLIAAREYVLGGLYAAAGKGLSTCPPSPTPATKCYEGAGHGAHTRSSSPRTAPNSTSTRVSAMRCYGQRAVWASVASRRSLGAGAPSSTDC